MCIGHFFYDSCLDRWVILDSDDCFVRELHCGDVVEVRPFDDDGASWFSLRVELDSSGWYLLGPGFPRDDFELLDVRF